MTYDAQVCFTLKKMLHYKIKKVSFKVCFIFCQNCVERTIKPIIFVNFEFIANHTINYRNNMGNSFTLSRGVNECC